MKKILAYIIMLTLFFTPTACSSRANESTTQENKEDITTTNPTQTTVTGTGAASAEESLAENSKVNDDQNDYVWDDSTVIPIKLNENSITTDGAGVTIDGSKATITSAGTYSISGSLTDGQIIVDTDDKDLVRLIFNGIDIHCSNNAPIFISKSEKTIIILAENTENNLSDGETYMLEDPQENEPNAALFSKSDLSISGNGSLTVNGNYNDGITSKDGLIVSSGTITVSSKDDGIRGKDYLVIKDGIITVTAQGDGLKSDNEEDAAKGFIFIEDGIFNITSGGDAIAAQTDVIITDGEISLLSGGGSDKQLDETISAKGIKGVVGVNIDNGNVNIDVVDDAIHSNGAIVINDGTYNITSGDDGIHADSTLNINGGVINITESYEGIESAVITINNGEINIVSSDDGINVAAGNDGSGMNPGMGPGGQQMPGGGPGNQQIPGGRPGNQQMPGGGLPGQDTFTYSGNYYLYINGGYIVVDAAGDGIDVNGAIEITNGVVIVNGPTEQMNGALDYDASFNMMGGTLVAVGSSGMAMAPGQTSSQYSVLVNFNTTLQAGDLVHIQDNSGNAILTFAPSKRYQSIVFSSSALEKGNTYDIYIGGSSSGAENDGFYQDGTYNPGTLYESFTITDVVTQIGTGMNRP